MNSFQTISHLLRTDLRRFRFFLAGFFLLNVATVWIERAALPREFGQGLFNFLRLVQLITFGLLVIQVIQADSAAHTRSQWWTRPIGGGRLWTAKAAYILLGLWLPALLVYIVGWVYDDFSLRQIGMAAGELTLYVSGIAAFLGGIASITANFWLAIGGMALTLFGLALGAFLADWTDWRLEESWKLSLGTRKALFYAALMVSGAFCFLAAYCVRRKRLAVTGLLLLVLMPFWYPERKLQDPEDRPFPHALTVRPPAEEESRERAVARNVMVEGLPPNHFAVPSEAEWIFSNDESDALFMILQKGPRHHVRDPDIDYRRYVWPVVREMLPGDIRHLSKGDQFYNRQDQWSINLHRDIDIARPGHLRGELRLTVYEVVHVGELAMREGGRVSDRGHSLQVQDVSRDDAGFRLTIRWSRPGLILSRDFDDRVIDHQETGSAWLLVATYPETGEAEFIQQNQHLIGGPFPITFHGTSWINLNPSSLLASSDTLPELHAFRIIPKGSQWETINWENHLVDTDLQSPASDLAEDTDGLEGEREFDELADLDYYSWHLEYPEVKKAEVRVMEVLADDLAATLARSPWHEPVFPLLVKVLDERLTEAELPAFRAALERDPRLVRVVESRGWGRQFRDYVTKELARRNPGAEPSLLWIAVGFRDPALSEDLRWHFIHGRIPDRTRLYQSLRNQPGLDPDAMLLEAWERGRRLGELRDFIGLGLDHGLPGAMEAAVELLYRQGTVDREQESGLVKDLLEATDYDSPLEAFYGWIATHAEALIYDPETGRYHLPDAS